MEENSELSSHKRRDEIISRARALVAIDKRIKECLKLQTELKQRITAEASVDRDGLSGAGYNLGEGDDDAAGRNDEEDPKSPGGDPATIKQLLEQQVH